ncbi:hypothetical protein A0H81_03157 [Grifola frondosa]|uniref:Uncharacterized protein n=1 Tax=Grifola frondosa TaxID=5627 RepID=A0A1C7MJZ8_GRIFR|nr:hypothetical protein A0H81_03157 [Grifola frondosa]
MVVRNIITRPYDPNRTPASASSPTEKDTENVPLVPAIPSTPLGSPGLRARPRSPIKARTLRQRVTVHMSKGSAPVLELHRFSALNLDPFRDQLGVRATSLPVNLDEMQRTKISRLSASFTPLPTLPPAFIPAVNSPSMSWPPSVLDINSPSSATYVGSPMSLLNSAGTVTSFASRAGTERHTIAIVDVRPTSALSSMTTASDMRALTIQFPGIPPPRRPRSMLSREITRQDVAVPMPADASALVRRGSSVKRKPVPPFYATPAEEEARGEYAYRVVDERQAAASLPTPISITESPIRSRPKRRVLRRRATSDSKRSRARSLSVGESSMQRNVEEDRGVVGVEEDVSRVVSKMGGHTRARSVGSAPRRMTSSRRATQPRDSLQMKRDHAEIGESTAADSGSSALRRQVEAIDVVRQSVFA